MFETHYKKYLAFDNYFISVEHVVCIEIVDKGSDKQGKIYCVRITLTNMDIEFDSTTLENATKQFEALKNVILEDK